MSNRKKRNAKHRLLLLEYVQQNGGILVNSQGCIGESANLRRLAKDGKLKRVRIYVPSVFGPHIRRTYYVCPTIVIAH